ncbi:MAG: HAD hydrolase-like protein [Planctomycetota bacterium]|nr:HAD hydrolase-like protein [Planctomycetota bacterium]
MTPTPTLLLFDIDGTILRTGGAGMRAMSRVAARLFGDHFTWEGIDSGGHLDPLIFAEAAAINGLGDDPAHHERFHDHYVVELREELRRSTIEIMPGIHGLLAALREREAAARDIVMGCLTGNYTRAVPLKLASVGVQSDWFRVCAFGDEGRTRPDLVALAMRKYEAHTGHKAHPRRVIVIGDTPRDVACAHAHDCLVLAVATGSYTVEKLVAAGADRAVESLADPRPLLEMIEASQRG